jgi:hypothetical protein
MVDDRGPELDDLVDLDGRGGDVRLRLLGLGGVILIRGGPGDLVGRLAHFDAHPPLYFLLVQAWSIFGSSDAWLRALSVVFGVASIPLIHRLASRLGGPGAGLAAAAFLALSPYHVYYSREARSYALLGLLCVLSLDLLFDLASAPNRRKLRCLRFAGILIVIRDGAGADCRCSAGPTRNHCPPRRLER